MRVSGKGCAGCGMLLVPAASFVTEVGDLCRQCFASFQNDQEARAQVAADLDRRLALRTSRVGRVHGVIWAVTFILTAEAMRLPDAGGLGLFIAAAAMAIGLRWRKRWAYLAALALDWPGTVALIVLGATSFKPGRGWIALFVPPFTLAMGLWVWRLRGAYARPKTDDALSLR